MIEILHAGNTREGRPRIGKKNRNLPVSGSDKSFSTELANAVAADVEGDLDDLLSDLRDQEKRFLELQNLYELSRYKALVQKILRTAINEGAKTRKLKRRFMDNRSEFVVAEIINSKLIELSGQLTRGNSAFNLMKTIEEIRGLILDLVH